VNFKTTLAPAQADDGWKLQAFRPNLNEALKEGGRDSSGAEYGSLRSVLVVAAVVLTLVLLIGAGLMFRTFLRLNQVEMGVDPQQLLTLRIILPKANILPSKRSALSMINCCRSLPPCLVLKRAARPFRSKAAQK
jgi:hypothetical protein